MKNFIIENWFKLMIGLSAIMFSFGFMVESISPSFSNPNLDKLTIGTNSQGESMNVQELEYGIVFVDNGLVYHYKGKSANDVRTPDKWSVYEIRERPIKPD